MSSPYMMLPSAPKPVSPEEQKSVGGGWKLMPQTKVAFIGYLLLLISMIIYLIQNPATISSFIIPIIAYIVIYLVALYMINCTVTGNCNLLAWVYAYVIVVIAVLTILGLIMKLWKN